VAGALTRPASSIHSGVHPQPDARQHQVLLDAGQVSIPCPPGQFFAPRPGTPVELFHPGELMDAPLRSRCRSPPTRSRGAPGGLGAAHCGLPPAAPGSSDSIRPSAIERRALSRPRSSCGARPGQSAAPTPEEIEIARPHALLLAPAKSVRRYTAFAVADTANQRRTRRRPGISLD